MAFDVDSSGMIKVTPLVEWETATVADVGCAIRLVFARPGDALGTGSLVVQAAMTADQASELAQALEKMVASLQKVPRGTAH
jgi:hypothetical protein